MTDLSEPQILQSGGSQEFITGSTEVWLCFFVLAPVVSMLCTRFTCQKITVLGGIVTGFGMLGTALSPNIGIILVTYGIMGGEDIIICVMIFYDHYYIAITLQ